MIQATSENSISTNDDDAEFLAHSNMQLCEAETHSEKKSLLQVDEEALLVAVHDGNKEEVARLLKKGVNKECRDKVRLFQFLSSPDIIIHPSHICKPVCLTPFNNLPFVYPPRLVGQLF